MKNCDNCKYELVYFFDEPCVNCGRFKNWEPVNSVDKLVLLVGASGSGKTTIAKALEPKINIIHSYTTREPREPNEWGHTFINLPYEWSIYGDDNPKTSLEYKGSKMIAFFEGYGKYYFATKEQYKDKGTSIYVIDPSGAEQVQETLKDDDTVEVVTIFLMVDSFNRRVRMMQDRKVPLVVDRLRQDAKIFATCKCDYVVDGNAEIEIVLERIMKIIEGDK